MNRVIFVLIVMLSTAVLSRPVTAQDTDVRQVELLHQIELPAILPRATHVVAWSPDGSTLAIGGDEYVRLYNADTLEPLGHFEGHTIDVTNLDWSPDGKNLASGSADQTVRVWDVEQQETIVEFTAHVTVITDLEWRPGGDLIASADLSGLMHLWNAQTGVIEHSMQGLAPGDRPPGHPTEEPPPLTIVTDILSISWHPDGNQIAAAVGGGGQLEIWDAATGEMERRFATDSRGRINVASWSPDGNLLAIDGAWFRDDGRALQGDNQVLNALTGDMEARLNTEPRIQFDAIKWSPDGRFLATNSLAVRSFAGIDTLIIWDTSTWQPIAALQSGLNVGDPFLSAYYQDTIAWSPDSPRLASVGEDGLLRIWRIHED